MVTRKWIVGLLLAVVVTGLVSGCSAASDASKARSRAVIGSGGIVPAGEVRVAEYLNYYQQSFPEPTGTAIGLDLRLGNSQVPARGGEAWLQIGLQARPTATDEIAPLNLALVIDRSGSMDSAEKMPYLKQSLRVFLGSLAPEDEVAIVAYSDDAEVVLPSQKAGDRRWIDAAIQRLQPGGSTNLHAGLMLGFQEADRNFDIRRNNRVILLTDGIANVGVTDPERIAQAALAYNQKGIYLSTIGLGREFNDALLARLARQGKGAYHFVDSAAEMDKVFRQEVAGLVQKAAGEVSVLLQPGPGVRLIGLTGYEGVPPAGGGQVKLQDMGTGDSQVVLARLEVAAGETGSGGQRLIAAVELRYTDLFAQRSATQSRQASATVVSGSAGYDPLQEVAVLRNVTIQRTAEGLKEIDRLYQAHSYQQAWDLAWRLEQDLRRVASLTGDAQLVKDADLMRQYQDTLGEWIQEDTGRRPAAPDVGSSTSPLQPDRLTRSTPTPALTPIEIR